MKRYFVLILLFNFVSSMYAQQMVVDTIRYRFSYAIKGTLSETSKRQYDDELSVEVGDSVTYCYSRYQKDNDDLWKK